MTSHLTTRPRLSPELICQQHAMALHIYSYDCCVLPPLDSWDWDWDELHTLGAAGDSAAQEPAFFFPATPGVESPGSSEASGGYLQDAVAHWSARCNNKRQRMEASPPRRSATVSEDLLESFWDSGADGGDDGGHPRHDLNTTIPEAEIRCSFVSGEDEGAGASCREGQRPRGPSTQVAPAPAAPRGGEEEEEAGADAVAPPRPPRPRYPAAPLQQLLLQKATAGADHAAARRDDLSRPGGSCEASPRAAATVAPGCACPSSPVAGEEKRVLYPFAVVKPLGLDDGRMTTLSDVNKWILKRPSRPVHHPVGPFACGPAVNLARGLGLSGKAVVSLTKITTGGKGTVTIIRTRG